MISITITSTTTTPAVTTPAMRPMGCVDVEGFVTGRTVEGVGVEGCVDMG